MSFVKVSKSSVIGELVLCSPGTLNALTHADIRALKSGLAMHEADSSVRAIIIRSDSEKAFCAGGDVRQVREYALAQRFDHINDFFTDEYALNLAISRCEKPYIALMNGIAMGGGLGISVHGPYRVVTEKSLLAMPETRIGFFPDVGASYFLPRLPHGAGLWLGLTAASVKGHEAVSVGLATHYVNSDRLGALQEALQKSLDTGDDQSTAAAHDAVSDTLNTYSAPFPDNDFTAILSQRKQWFVDANLEGIHQRLSDAAQDGNQDAQHLRSLLDAGSPYSVKSTLELLEQTAGKSLQQCLELELALGAEAVRFPDCAEGIRAVLVDKDRNPRWQAPEP